MSALKHIGMRLSAFHITAILVVVACALHLPLNLNHDAAWHFQTAFRVLGGDALGIDVFDINPPMSAWLFSIPALFVNAFGGAPGIVFKLFFMAVAGAAILGHAGLLRRFETPPQQIKAMALFVGLAAFVLPGYDFAQREQFAALMALCYVGLVIFRAQGETLPVSIAVAIGAVAAIGICIKPYFLFLPIVMELWLITKRRNILSVLRVETLTMNVVFVAYLAAIFVFAPAYFDIVIPESLNNYGGFSVPIADVLQRISLTIRPLIIAFVFLFLIFKNASKDTSFQGYAMASLAFLLAAIAQQKGWHYQLYPVMFYGVLAIGSQLVQKDVSIRTVSPVGRAGVAALLALIMFQPALQFLGDGYGDGGTTTRIEGLETAIQSQVKDNGEPVSVMAFITSPRDVHPAVLNTKARWVHDAGAIVYLPAALDASAAMTPPENLGAILKTAKKHDEKMIAQLVQSPPDVIFVKSGPYKLAISDPDFDYIQFYSANPEFVAMMSSYVEQEAVGAFRVFTRQSEAQKLTLHSTAD